ncbi:MAG: hypothetical protein JNJ57_12830 [Saprospiraceae bacterium]|nr:hypothetical protein [Saprospiraceae bacterium]
MIQRNSLLLLLTFCLLGAAQSVLAQASGVKPELIMYRHNSSSTTSPSPIVTGNILGTLKWNGLTATNAIRTGATIRSVTKNVAPGFLMADMIFSTSGAAGLHDRMIITENGLVGIGTMDPQYHLHVVGNTHTSGDFFGRIHFDVNEPTDLPSSYFDEAYFERKTRAQLGLAANPISNGGILTMAPGGGSLDRQLFTGGTDGLWTRSQNSGGADAWETWQKILTSADISGTPNRIARFLPPDNPSSKLGDSQLFDDGTDVGIGTVTPDPAFLLTVGGDTKITGATRIEQALTVATNLHTVGTGTIDGNTLLGGTLTVNNHSNLKSTVDVDGESNFDQRMKIGAANYANGYLLSVGGKVIAEEVRVALQGTWPDYVFAEGAPTPDIKVWEQYIQTHKHLPGVPSASDVAKEGGIELGENQRILLEKVEQLTLMLIQQQKEIDALKAALKAEKN